MSDVVKFSGHSSLRSNERFHLKSDARVLRAAELAWERGKDRFSADTLQERRFLDMHTYNEESVLKLFNGAVYVFATDGALGTPILVTVYALPKNLTARYHKGKKIRNRKRFQRLYPDLAA